MNGKGAFGAGEDGDWQHEGEPAQKKRKGVIGSAVETGLSIAVGGGILGVAVALHAYQIWRGDGS